MPLLAAMAVIAVVGVQWVWPTIKPVFYTDILTPASTPVASTPVVVGPDNPEVCPLISRVITGGTGNAGQGWNTSGGDTVGSYAPGSILAFPNFGPRAEIFCPRQGWAWQPGNNTYELDHPAEKHPFLALFRRLATSIIRPGSDPFPQRPAVVDPQYPLGYNFWATYNAPFALIYHAWDWTEFIPGNTITGPNASCFGSAGGTSGWNVSMVRGGPVFGMPGGGTIGWPRETEGLDATIAEPRACTTTPEEAFFAYGVNVIDFAFGTDANDSITVSNRPGAMGFVGDDTLTGTTSHLGLTYIGGPGNDSILGRTGGDLYLYLPGDGHDTIHDNAAAISGSTEPDVLRILDTTLDDLTFQTSGVSTEDILIATPGGGSVRLVGAYSGRIRHQIERLDLDGATLDAKGLRDAAAEGMKATGFVLGSTGSETFTYRTGNASFSIQERGISSVTQFDELVFADLNDADVVWSVSGNNGIMTVPGGATITLINQRTNEKLEHVDSVRFADGTTLDWFEIRTRMGLAAPLSGSVSGGTGDDIYAYRRGNAAVSITDAGGFDTIYFPDYTSGELMAARLTSPSGTMTLTGVGADVLSIINQFGAGGSAANRIERFVFADGVELDWDGTMNKYMADAASIGGPVYSTPRDETLSWSPNSGDMVFDRINASGNGTDIVDILDVGAFDVTFSRVGRNAMTINASNGATLTLASQFVSTNSNLTFPTIRFPFDGTTYTYNQALQRYVDDAMIAGYVDDPSGGAQTHTFVGGAATLTGEVGGVSWGKDLSTDTVVYNRPLAGATISKTGNTPEIRLDFGGGDVFNMPTLGWNRATLRVGTHRFTDGDLTTFQLLDAYVAQAAARGDVVDTYRSDAITYSSGGLNIRRANDNEQGGATDTITFTGRTLASATLSRDAGRHMVIDFGGGDRVWIEHQFGSGAAAYALWDSFVFSDQTLTGAAMRALVP